MTPQPNTFVRAGTLEKVLNAFRSATGLTGQDAKITTQKDAARWVELNQLAQKHPFYATGSSTRILLNRGFVTYAGKTFYFPPATYSGAAGGGVFLKITHQYTTSEVIEDEIWSLMPVPSDPELVWMPAGTLGAYANFTLGPGGFGNTVGPFQELYIPIAGWSGSRVINYLTQNIILWLDGAVISFRNGWG